MKINFKRSMSVLAVCTTLFFQGCGGGTTGGTGGDDSGNNLNMTELQSLEVL